MPENPPPIVFVPPGTGDPFPAFSALDDDIPLLMLPVRLETRFAGNSDQRILKVRIYPDQIHLDDHPEALRPSEQAIGQRYWKAWHAASGAGEQQAAAREWLLARLEPHRAAYVARRTMPVVEPDSSLTFPSPPLTNTGRQARAAALPSRWAVIGYTRNMAGALVQRFIAWTRPIPTDLRLSVDPEQVGPWSGAPGALPVDPGIAWMVDYPTAVARGMAVTIDLSAMPDIAINGVAALVVVGVSTLTPQAGAGEFRRLLTAHNYSDGLSFVPQGTPTNNTDEVESGWSMREQDLDGLLARELEGLGLATSPTSNGMRLAGALGLPGDPLLARLASARLDEESPAKAMNRVLWRVCLGEYFNALLVNKAGNKTVDQAAIDATKQWWLEHVRGGASLPAIRVASQPYGILPVRLNRRLLQWNDPGEWYQETLLFLRDKWVEALAEVPLMDPVLGASGGTVSNDPESVLVDILASLPHPKRFLIRDLRDWRETSYDSEWAIILALFGLVFLAGSDPTYGYDALSVVGRWGWAREVLGDASYLNIPAPDLAPIDNPGLSDADAQITALQQLRTDLPTLVPPADVSNAEAWVDYMIGQVEKHRDRQPPLNEMNAPLNFSGVLADAVDDPIIAYCLYDQDVETELFMRELVESVDVEPGARAVDYLAALRQRVLLPPGPPPPPPALPPPLDTPVPLDSTFAEDEPLLYQLLDGIVDEVGAADAYAYRYALDELAAHSREELELRLRETLGLGSHRLDAWLTALARDRLVTLRSQSSQGLQLGGFGWVLDLVPDATGTRDSQGFIHAPSLQHAATAALLRAGWSAHGTASATSTLAVDLRGQRVRLASWLLDGVRQGQALGDLLGYRFERRLHDEGLDDWIDPVRRAVLVAAGISRAPRGPVDGLELGELHQAGGLATVIGDATVEGDGVALTAALDDIGEALDAVGDAMIAESIHQVAQGNMTRAAAALDAASLGEVAPPELSHIDTPRGSDRVTHRVVVMLGDGGGSSTWITSGPRASAAPLLETWASHLLGAPSRVYCEVALLGSDGSELSTGHRVAASDLAISALDAVFEAPAESPAGDSAWGRRIRAWVRDNVPGATAIEVADLAIDFDAAIAAAGEISFSELAELARVLRATLSRARSMDARDLVMPDQDSDRGLDLDELETRSAALEASFRAAVTALDALLPEVVDENDPHPVGEAALTDIRAAMRTLAGFSLINAVSTSGWIDDTDDRAALHEEAWVLSDRAASRVAELDEAWVAWNEADALADPSDDERLARARTIAELQLGRGFPLHPRFTAVDSAAISNAFARTSALLGGDPAVATGWLQQIAKVRPEAALLDDLASVSELLHEQTKLGLMVAQLPEVLGETWVARAAPSERTGGRVAWVAVDHGGLAAIAGSQTSLGLVVDEWVESIPRSKQTTGLTFHFDAPASRAPQALLLAVPPRVEDSWDFNLVVDTVVQTLQDAQIRAVAPESLDAYGQHIPTIFTSKRLRPGVQPESGESE